ncbi:TniQ family protein [Paenibacillus cellulositrophicus]|uniref:TniQ family protein n=1 Tax=Paenibacillus cellulositrophicus TaxID=562959 RepID=UPI003F823AA7
MEGNIPKIISGESLASYIYRVCRAFHFDSLISFVAGWNMKEAKIKNNEFSLNELEQIAEFTGQDKKTLIEMTGDYWKEQWGAEYYNKLIQKNKIKFCPCCVRHSNIHKKIWTVLHVAICPEHKTILVDRCQGCNCSISMDNFMYGFCLNCNFNFSRSSVEIIDEKSFFFKAQIRLINKISNTSLNEDDILNHFTSKEIFPLVFCSFYLLSGMRSFIDYGSEFISPYSNKKDKVKDQINAATAFGNVLWMLQDFPKNLYLVLESFHSNKGKIMYIQKPEFEKLFKLKKFEFIHKAYNAFWIEKFNNGQIRRDFSVFKEDKSLFNHVRLLRKDDIKNRFQLTYDAIGKIYKNGLIQIENIHRGKNVRYLIECFA